MRYLPVVIVVLVFAGCGGARSDRHAAPAQRSSELVAFQRNGGLAATLDTVTVRSDGATRSDKRHGGAGRRYVDFRLPPALLRRLRAALERLPARLPRAGEGDRAGDTYLLRYRGRTYWARQGAVPAVLRPAVAILASIVDGAGRGGRATEVTQAPS